MSKPIFLNCNYPNKPLIPKGIPRECRTKKNRILEMKMGKVSLIALANGNIYLGEDGYWFGIVLDKFIVINAFGVSVVPTLGNINLALWQWAKESLSGEKEDLLAKYLRIIV